MGVTEFGGIVNHIILFPKSGSISLVFDFPWSRQTKFLRVF